MNILKLSSVSLAVIASIGLSGCGGGGGGGTGSATANNTTVGVVSAFGSVYVNGCEYDTSSTSISVEGQSATEDDLSVGDVVEITGSSNCTTGTATHIKSADELEGWVDSVSGLDTNGIFTMVVMGQTVTVTEMTVFEDNSGLVATINNIAANHVVEIHGFSSDQGTILATKVEVKATSLTDYLGDIELKGVVKNHNDTNSTFDIGALTINYTSIAPAFTLTNNLLVEVKFDSSKNPVSIEIENDGKLGYHGDDDEEVEIYGVLTLALPLSGNEFMLGEQKIQVTNTTEYEEVDEVDGAATLTLLDKLADTNMLGKLYLEVEGKFVNGVLVAKKVEFEDDMTDNNECKGTVSNLTATAGEMNAGTFTITAATTADCEGQNSMNVIVNNSTMMEDDSTENVSKFNLTYLRNGDLVEVYIDPASGAAMKLERK